MTLDEFFRDNEAWRPYADLVAAPPTAGEIEAEFPKCDMDVLRRAEEGWPTVGALYVRIRREGNDDKLAAMLALRQAPRIMTDNVFFEGMKRLGDTYDDGYLKSITTAAIKHGYRPNPNDVYQPGLARFRGDPEAFVSPTGGRGYIKKLCEKRGWAVEGAVNVAHREPESDPHTAGPGLSDKLIRENAQRMIAKDPSLKRLDRRELRTAVLEKHGPSK